LTASNANSKLDMPWISASGKFYPLNSRWAKVVYCNRQQRCLYCSIKSVEASFSYSPHWNCFLYGYGYADKEYAKGRVGPHPRFASRFYPSGQGSGLAVRGGGFLPGTCHTQRRPGLADHGALHPGQSGADQVKTGVDSGLFSSPIMSLRAVPDGEAIPTLPTGDCFIRFASSQ
jgi:hypothetical protein